MEMASVPEPVLDGSLLMASRLERLEVLFRQYFRYVYGSMVLRTHAPMRWGVILNVRLINSKSNRTAL